MSVELTQSLTEMSTRNISWGGGGGGGEGPVRKADKFTTLVCRLSWSLWASTSLDLQGLSRPVMKWLLHLKKIFAIPNFK